MELVPSLVESGFDTGNFLLRGKSVALSVKLPPPLLKFCAAANEWVTVSGILKFYCIATMQWL